MYTDKEQPSPPTTVQVLSPQPNLGSTIYYATGPARNYTQAQACAVANATLTALAEFDAMFSHWYLPAASKAQAHRNLAFGPDTYLDPSAFAAGPGSSYWQTYLWTTQDDGADCTASFFLGAASPMICLSIAISNDTLDDELNFILALQKTLNPTAIEVLRIGAVNREKLYTAN